MLSICIPAYKHVSLTYDAAKSILQQDADFELIVLDDFYLVERTHKNLFAIDELKTYLHSDKRVKCFSNEKLLPIQVNWNKTVSLANGRYIKLLGADDRVLPGSIGRILQMINDKPSVAFHGHLANVIDASGLLIRQQRFYGSDFVNKEIMGAEALKAKIRQQVRFKEPACNFYLKNAWEKIGGYDSKFRFTFDIYFNAKMMSAFKSTLWNEYLVELRRHQASDGAQLPASLALADLQSLVSELLSMIGDEASLFDKAAAHGLIQYRLIELVAQRMKFLPLDMCQLIAKNIGLFASNPIALYYMAKLLINRGILGDVQQH